MKKLIYLFVAMGAYLFTSCNPMDDIYTAIDAQQQVISGDVTFTLTDADYAALSLNYGNFNSVDDAKAMIPALLATKYPVWGKGSSAIVSFNVYAPKKTEKSLVVYTVTTADYDAYPDTSQYNNFNNMSQVYRLLNDKYPTPSDRMLVALKYKYYNGSVNTVKNGFIYVNGAWNFLQGFTAAEYSAMGEGHDNFTSKTTAEARIPIYLKDYFKYDNKKAGDIEGIMYNIYQTDYNDIDGDGSTTDKATYSYAFYCIYDGTNWAKYTDVIVETVKFGHDGTTWVPDNTIKYTLTSADYTLVGESYPDFYIKNKTPDEVSNIILTGINTILIQNFPGMAEGQKFSVTYDVYDGSLSTRSSEVILSGGVYVFQ